MVWPTNPSTHTPTHKLNTHPWVGKSLQISNLQTESKYLDSFKSYSDFTDLGGTPPRGWVGVWLGVGLGGGTPMYVHVHAHTCMHVKHDEHGCFHGGSHLEFPTMFILAFPVCACVHMHVHMSRDTPMPPDAPTHLPLLRDTGSPNHRKFISPELIKII